MQNFTYQAAPMRVIFGTGTLGQLPAELERLGIARALILATPHQARQAEEVAAMIGQRAAGTFAQAEMHTPVHVTERALIRVSELDADGVVAIGGGSTTGLGKAIARRTDLPQIVVPTSYAGSEMTPILGETQDGLKTTQSSPKVLPETVIYDVDLTMTMPPSLSATSGLNAIAHAAEALYARDQNPIISLMAEEGIRSLARALPKISAAGHDIAARTDALYGAWLCGCCLGAVGMALHHKLCHTPKHMRPCCRTRSPTTHPRHRKRWRGLRGRSVGMMRRPDCLNLRVRSVCSGRCASSACRSRTSIGRRASRSPIPIGTRGPWSARRYAG